MAGWQVIDLLGFAGKLSYQRGQLVVIPADSSQPVASVPLAQIATILVSQKTDLNSSLIGKLSELDITCVVCDWKNTPIAALTPWSSHTRVGARQRAQADLTLPRMKSAWAQIIAAKITGQATTLSLLDRSSPREWCICPFDKTSSVTTSGTITG